MKGKSLPPVLLRLLLLLNFVFPLGVLCKSDKTSDEYLNEAKEFLAQGNQQEALNSMDEAISKDPNNYLSLYKRAVIHISLGRSKNALDDLDRVLELSPQFDQAVLHRARLHSRDCRLELAKKDLNSIEKKGQEAYEMISDIDKAKLNMEIFERLKDDGKLESEIQRIKGKKGAESETVEKAKRLLGEIIAVCSGDGSLRLKRAEIYESLGDIPMAIGDYTRAASLLSDNLPILQKVTELHAKNGDLDMAIVALKQCLHYDPENKKCSKQFKLIKKLLKNFDEADKKIEGRKHRAALDEYLDPLKERKKMKGTQKGIIESLDELDAGGQARKRALVMVCEAYFRLKRADDAIDWCSKALELTDDTNTLCNRAEAYLLKDEFKKAADDFSRARDLSNGTPSQRILEGLQKTQKLERMAKKKDYYKILGVDKQADDATIKKAFRSLAKQYHPDKYRGDPKEAQDKMAELNQAYEVLSNKELRQRYDNGDDPNDPMSGQEGFQQGGGFPFGGPVFFQSGGFPGGGGGRHGGFPFGGGGFEFRFN